MDRGWNDARSCTPDRRNNHTPHRPSLRGGAEQETVTLSGQSPERSRGSRRVRPLVFPEQSGIHLAVIPAHAGIQPLICAENPDSKYKGADEDICRPRHQGYKALEAKDIAESVVWVASRPPHVQIAEMIILPSDQASAAVLNRRE